jgi:oligopeptide/dipeptide ABC transporter ATP-binding protein
MYLGKIVELGPADDVLERPLHPYTRALVSAARLGERHGKRILLAGDPPSPVKPAERLLLSPALQLRNPGLQQDRSAARSVSRRA